MRLMLLAFLLVGCATQPADDRPKQFAAFNEQINAQRTAKQIGYADGQRKKQDYAKRLWPDDPYAGEFFSYTVLLGGKVDRGEMPADEYMYLSAQKGSEIAQRHRADASRNAQDAAALLGAMPQYQAPRLEPYRMKQPTRTNCYTDSLGYTNCTTQ